MTELGASIALYKQQCHEVLEMAYSLLLTALTNSENVQVQCPWETIALAVLTSAVTKDSAVEKHLPYQPPSLPISFSVLAQTLVQKSEQCIWDENFTSAWNYASAAHLIADNNIGTAYFHLGRVLDLGFDLKTKAREMYEAGLSKSITLKEKELIQTSFACLCADSGDLDAAHSLLSTLTASRQLHLAEGYLHSLQGNWKQALVSFQHAEDRTEALTPYYQAIITFNQATAYDNLNDFSEAWKLYQSLVHKSHIGTIPLLCYRNCALIQFRRGELAAARKTLKEGVSLGRKRLPQCKALAELLEALAELLHPTEMLKKAKLLGQAGRIYRKHYPYMKERVANAVSFAAVALSIPTLLTKARNYLCSALFTGLPKCEDFQALAACEEALGGFDHAERHLVAALRCTVDQTPLTLRGMYG